MNIGDVCANCGFKGCKCKTTERMEAMHPRARKLRQRAEFVDELATVPKRVWRMLEEYKRVVRSGRLELIMTPRAYKTWLFRQLKKEFLMRVSFWHCGGNVFHPTPEAAGRCPRSASHTPLISADGTETWIRKSKGGLSARSLADRFHTEVFPEETKPKLQKTVKPGSDPDGTDATVIKGDEGEEIPATPPK